MSNDYVPATDEGKKDWLLNLAEKVTASPSTWGSTSTIATSITTKADLFATRLAAARNPNTKGPIATTAKNVAREDAIALARQIANTAQGVVGLTAVQKESIGITDRYANPATPINQPTGAPVFEVLWQKNREIGVALRTGGSERRGKPAGVQGCSICMYSGPLPLPTDVTKWVTIGESSRTNFTVEVPVQIEAGTVVHLLAFWKNPRLMSGPPSSAVAIVIGEGQQQTA